MNRKKRTGGLDLDAAAKAAAQAIAGDKQASEMLETDAPDLQRAISYLTAFGYIQPLPLQAFGFMSPVLGAASIKTNVQAFQRTFGLDETGELDESTLNAMAAPRCGCPDVQMMRAEPVIWRKRELTYGVQNYAPGLPRSVWDGIFEAGYRHISETFDLKFTRVTSGTPDITIFARRIDGPGSVLAQAQLQPGGDRPLWLQFDDGDRWVERLSGGGNEILALNVFIHEAGHNLDFDHIPPQSGKALMNPMYDPRVDRFQPADVQYGLSKGYRPAQGGTPPPPPTDGAWRITLEVDKRTGAARLVG